MSFELVHSTATSFSHVTEAFPFDKTTLVYKVGGKMFLLIDIESPNAITLKSTPSKVDELTESCAWITPGFHMNKSHWVTIHLSHPQTDFSLVTSLISESYCLVFSGLSNKVKNVLENR
jgi:predicted DNA-binding protein (MmcQ/YjbR family)